MWALRRDPPSQSQPQDRNNQGPRLPDSTSALVGPRLNIHNRVQSLIRAGDLDSSAAIARHAVFSSVRPTVFTCNAIIAAMYRAGRHSDAKVLFQYFFNQSDIIPNIVSYNNLIVAHCGTGDVDESIKVYHHILEAAPFSPSAFTYRNLTKGLINAGRINDAVDLLREMLNRGQGADSLVYNNLISGFLNLGNLDKANELFEELQERCLVYDGVVSATFMDWYFKQGREKEAMESYKYLMDKQFRMVPATCNVLLEVLLKYGKEKEAWQLFDNMLDNHTPPTFQAVNSDTISIMVNECFRLGKIAEAMEVFKKVGKGAKSRPFAMDVAGFNNMIIRLCELEMTEEAENYLAQLQSKSLSPDVTTYRTFIEAYIKLEKLDEALDKYAKMAAAHRVIPEYANKWFNFFIEKGKVTECVPILMKMGEAEIKPDATTYDIVIRGLCGIGDLDTCSSVVGQMMAVGVGITPKLKEFLLDAFEKEGRREVIARIVNSRFPFYSPPQPSGSSQMQRQAEKPWQTLTAQAPPAQMATQASPQSAQTQWQARPQTSWQAQASAGSPQMSWQGQASTSTSQMSWQGQTSTNAPQMAWQGQMSTSAPQMSWQGQASRNALQMSWEGQASSGASQMSEQGQASSGAAQMACQASSSSSHQVSWQAPGSQLPGEAQSLTRTAQMSWQSSTPAQMPGQSSVEAAGRPWQTSFAAETPERIAGFAQFPGQASFYPQKHASPAQVSEQAASHSQMPEQLAVRTMAE